MDQLSQANTAINTTTTDKFQSQIVVYLQWLL